MKSETRIIFMLFLLACMHGPWVPGYSDLQEERVFGNSADCTDVFIFNDFGRYLQGSMSLGSSSSEARHLFVFDKKAQRFLFNESREALEVLIRERLDLTHNQDLGIGSIAYDENLDSIYIVVYYGTIPYLNRMNIARFELSEEELEFIAPSPLVLKSETSSFMPVYSSFNITANGSLILVLSYLDELGHDLFVLDFDEVEIQGRLIESSIYPIMTSRGWYYADNEDLLYLSNDGEISPICRGCIGPPFGIQGGFKYGDKLFLFRGEVAMDGTDTKRGKLDVYLIENQESRRHQVIFDDVYQDDDYDVEFEHLLGLGEKRALFVGVDLTAERILVDLPREITFDSVRFAIDLREITVQEVSLAKPLSDELAYPHMIPRSSGAIPEIIPNCCELGPIEEADAESRDSIEE